MRSVIVTLTEDQFRILELEAMRRHARVQDLIQEFMLAATAELEGYDVTQDSIFNISSHDSSGPADTSVNVDHYLYGARKR